MDKNNENRKTCAFVTDLCVSDDENGTENCYGHENNEWMYINHFVTTFEATITNYLHGSWETIFGFLLSFILFIPFVIRWFFMNINIQTVLRPRSHNSAHRTLLILQF